jgi:hypothetical protein
VADAEDDVAYAVAAQKLQLVLEEGLAFDVNHRFGEASGQVTQACAQATSEDDSLHAHTPRSISGGTCTTKSRRFV